MARGADLDALYSLLQALQDHIDGPRKLANCHGRMDWPDRGLYVFLSNTETRHASDHPRITRIGTHAVSAGSSTTLWNRLRTHRGAMRGTYEGGGNHRGSVFRRHVGRAMIDHNGLQDKYPHWGEGSSAGRERRLEELSLERRVSDYIRDLPFLWFEVDDEPGSDSDRASLEKNLIALVSNFQKETIDPRADDWLGHHSPEPEIRDSGLWNVDHVAEGYDPTLLDRLYSHIGEG